MLIVKLGGSIITDKTEYLHFRKVETDRIMRELKKIDDQIIIIHGAGSFGHIKAKEYGLPGSVNERTLQGFSLVHNDVMHLNHLVMESVISAGFNAISIPPAVAYNEDMDYAKVEKFISRGLTVVSHGDCYILENEIGIISGDTIVKDLAKMYSPEQVIFFSDVDGIYDRNPKETGEAKLIRSLDDSMEFSVTVDDVTGGMKRKLDEMREIAKYSGGVYLINGRFPERLKDIGTEAFIGTEISDLDKRK